MIDKNDIWAFPDLHNESSGLSVVEREYLEKERVYQQTIDDLNRRLDEKDQHLSDANDKVIHYKSELEIQSQLLRVVTNEVQSILPELSQYLLSFIEDIVKKITKKVIMKEVAADPLLLTNLINSFIKKMDSSEIINVSLSANSFARLSNLDMTPNIRWRINPDLEDTDVIVATDSSAMRMIIDDVLNHLMSGSYESIS